VAGETLPEFYKNANAHMFAAVGIDHFGHFADSFWRAPTIMSGRVAAISIIENGKWSAAYESDVASANLYLGFFYHFPC
jgi:hypothetical protein